MLSTNEEYARRLAICQNCPHMAGTKVPTCNLCGCLLKMKARLLDFDCPIGKWSGNDQVLTPFMPLHSIAGGCNSCGGK